MPRRRIAFIAAAICAAAFIVVMAWSLVAQARLSGSQICAQNAEAAALFGGDGPGLYRFDDTTGRPVRVPASMALSVTIGGIFSPHYPGQAACGARALTQTTTGLLAIASLLGALIALLIGVFTRAVPVPVPAT